MIRPMHGEVPCRLHYTHDACEEFIFFNCHLHMQEVRNYVDEDRSKVVCPSSPFPWPNVPPTTWGLTYWSLCIPMHSMSVQSVSQAQRPRRRTAENRELTIEAGSKERITRIVIIRRVPKIFLENPIRPVLLSIPGHVTPTLRFHS